LPASVISSSVSWGVYLAAASCLLAILVPPAGWVAQESRALAQRTEVEGAAGVLNGLEPGVSVRFVLGTAGGQGAIVMYGHEVTLVSTGSASEAYCRWNLPDATIYPDVPYTLTLSGSSVEVTAHG